MAGAFWNYRFAAACFNTGKERIFIIASYRNLGCNKKLYNKRVDSSIKNVTVNDFTKILNKSDIRAIFANGNKAYDLYEKYVFETVGIKAVKLPSTSPANARWNLEKLETAYSGMLKYIAD